MIEKSSKITIIDYKTAQDGANITHNREYKKQVENYIKAISDIKKDSTIDGYLCFIKDSSIELVKV
jgi:ATP-dependent exoDNAse (exonuclease V) beta subunit